MVESPFPGLGCGEKRIAFSRSYSRFVLHVERTMTNSGRRILGAVVLRRAKKHVAMSTATRPMSGGKNLGWRPFSQFFAWRFAGGV
jgi:hypothetical protein